MESQHFNLRSFATYFVQRSSIQASALCLSLVLHFSAVQAFDLSTGTGDGSLTVSVDGYGAFGSSIGGVGTSDALYDPVGLIDAAGTVFESATAISFANIRPFLSSNPDNQLGVSFGDISLESESSTSLVTQFSFAGLLDIRLTQSVSPTLSDGIRTGSILNQLYEIRNSGDVTTNFDVVRYLDGDLEFDESIDDGGGRITLGGTDVLFETDAASGSEASTTFVGITGVGGIIPSTNRFQVSSYDALLENVQAGLPLADFVENDTDNDGFIDSAYDVTLALRNIFSLAPNEQQTYTTQTLFGNAVPPSPGSLETLPLLPSDSSAPFVFDIASTDIVEGEIIWIDPEIATGYSYEVDGALFSSVTAPSLASVADPDGYTLLVDFGSGIESLSLLAGETIDFLTAVNFFEIVGIDLSLMLDPNDQTAFVTGITLTGVFGTIVSITQSPLTAPVPLPASLLLFGAGLAGLRLFSRASSTDS